MMVVGLLILVPIVLIAILVRGRKKIRLLYWTTKIRGPSLWDLVTVHAKHLLSDNLVYHLQNLCESYDYKPWGMWTFRGFVVIVSDCESISDVYKNKNMNTKPDMFYKAMASYFGDGLITLNGEVYKRHRKMAGPAFRKSATDAHLPRVNKLTTDFMEILKSAANAENFDIRPLVRDHISGLALSMFSSGHFPSQRMLPLFKLIERGLCYVQLESINPLYYWLVHRWKKSTQETFTLIKATLDVARQIYQEEKVRAVSRILEESDPTPRDILEIMIRYYVDNGQDNRLDEEGFAEVVTVIGASQDTSTFVVNIVLLLLALHPTIQQRVYEEAKSIMGSVSRPVEPEDISHMVYLEMVIKETLRLFPPVPLIARRAEEEVTLNGVTVPNGCTVIIDIMALHRNPSVYADPLKFDPDRFSPELSERRNSVAFNPFSAGYRSCPGQLQASLMIKTTLCYIVREYKIFPGKDLKSVNDIKLEMHFSSSLKESSLGFSPRSHT